MKSFKNILVIGLFTVGLSTFYSCNKLDLKPSDTIDPEKAYRNLDDIDMAIKGAYAGMTYTLIGNSVVVSDEAIYPLENTVGNVSAYRWQYTASSSSVTSTFGEYYVVIDRANRALAGLEKLEKVDTDKKKHYQGELLAIRAFAHVELLRAYAAGYEPTALGIPYMLKSEIGHPPRKTVAEVISLAQKDINDALGLIGGEETVYRFSKTGLYALQARTALYAKDWTLAIAASSKVIAAKPLADRTSFPKIWSDESSNEVVFSLRRTAADLPKEDDSPAEGPIGAMFFRQDGEIALYTPSNKLIALFDKKKDIRFGSYILDDPNRGEGKEQYLIGKYLGRKEADATAGLVDVKLFRTGEMYLIRAEANAETNKLNEANSDLNVLRKARIQDYQNQVIASKDELIDAILAERYKELAFEGHRFFDLKRRKMPVRRGAQDAINTAGALLLESTKAQYNFPIPADEIFVNKNMVQNPGYTK